MSGFGGANSNLGNRHADHSFSTIPKVNMARSVFDRSHAAKMTFNFDYLTPVFVDEIIPGDTMNLKVNNFVRLATQVVPVMDNMYIDWFFFFVPNRLTFANWEKMCGAQNNPGDSTDYIFPTVTSPSGGFLMDSLADYFGLPIGVAGIEINSLPFRAYNLIYNDWFKDQNLQDAVVVETDNGPDTYSNYTLLKRGMRHNYLTASLPFLQKASAVDLPIGGSAPVVYSQQGVPWLVRNDSGTLQPSTGNIGSDGTSALHSSVDLTLDPNGTLFADLSAATAATINQLRQAFQMQALFELDARGGTRYVEILLAHFNVVSPDFRLQRSEFLGGGTQKISSHPVPQTSATASGAPQGNLAAFGTSASNGQIGFNKSFVEHGYVIGMCAARADLTYQQGVERMWYKSTRYDLFWPKLQELGEQAVFLGEIYAQGTSEDLGVVWGYQERYAEYRYKMSSIRGNFRSTSPDPLDYWHLAQYYGSIPALNGTFIESTTPIQRVIYDTEGDALLMDMWFDLKHVRPMVTYSVPVSLGRF